MIRYLFDLLCFCKRNMNEDEHNSIQNYMIEAGEGFFDAIEEAQEDGDIDDDDIFDTEEEEERSHDSSSSSSSSSSDTSMSTPPQEQRARDHAYLPGPSHPLLASPHGSAARPITASLSTTDAAAAVDHTSRMTEIPILELPGVVLFPGCTIPLRLSNRPWIQYLGRQIDASRKVGSPYFGQTVQLGILTYEDRQRHADTTYNDGDNVSPRRRSSLLRRAIAGAEARRRTRRLSRILQQALLGEINDDDDDDSEDDDDDDEEEEEEEDNNINSQRQQHQRRNLHPFVGRIGTIATIAYTHGDALLDNNSSTTSSSRRISGAGSGSGSGVWQQHSAEDQIELILKAVGTTRFQVESYLEFQSFAEVQVFQVQELQQDTNTLRLPSFAQGIMPRKLPFPKDQDYDAPTSNDQHDGQDNDHRDNQNVMEDTYYNSDRNNKNNDQCRRMGAIDTNYFVSHHESLIRHLSAVTPIPYKVFQQVWPWRLVGQILESLEAASHHNNNNNNPEDDMDTDDDEDHDEEEEITASTRRRRRPSRLLTSLAELLRQEDQESSSSSSLQNNNSSNNKIRSFLVDDPTTFSFWMANNMPLSLEEKLQLLQIPTTVERLQLLQQKLNEITQSDAAGAAAKVCCASCHIPLSRVDSVFTVGGAEGTTGNYCNPHGYIHSVLTLRRVRTSLIYCAPPASTENSYFPGYSWTITYCRRCGSLLGWKFDWVGNGSGRSHAPRHFTPNHPECFYGFQASSVVTQAS
jgi:hypothetical protein